MTHDDMLRAIRTGLTSLEASEILEPGLARGRRKPKEWGMQFHDLPDDDQVIIIEMAVGRWRPWRRQRFAVRVDPVGLPGWRRLPT